MTPGINDVRLNTTASARRSAHKGKIDENVFLSARNLPHVLVLETQEVDPVSLVRFENVLLTKAAVTQFEELLG